MKKIIYLIVTCFILLACETTEVNKFANVDGDKLLKEAIRENDLDLIRELLDSNQVNLDPPHVNNLINKPLAYAVQFGTLDSVKLILEYNVDIDGQVSYGDSPLLKALENRNFDMAKYLIESGADLNIPNFFGYSPFTGLCMTGYSDFVQIALDNGARINEPYLILTSSEYGKYRLNALQMAVDNRHYDIVQILLDNGGDPNFKTNGLSAIDLANKNKDDKMLKLLKPYADKNRITFNTEEVELQRHNSDVAVVEDYQINADIVRLRHLKYYSSILREYYIKTGKYPFQYQENRPLYVYIANDKQEEFTKEPLPFDHKLISHKEFILELERVLDRDVLEYFDPQYSPDYKPNFYIYSVVNSEMYFAVHVSKKYDFSKKIADNYYKVEVSNILVPFQGIYTLEYLENSKDFNNVYFNKINKVGYFLEREGKYINFSD